MMDNRIALLERKQAKKSIPVISPGDTVSVYVKVVEGGEEGKKEKGKAKTAKKDTAKEVKERIQKFEGTVIATHGDGLRQTVTVRKISWGVGVERVFLVHSPKVDRIKVERHGRVRRAKLFYLRGRSAKAARISEIQRDPDAAAVQHASDKKSAPDTAATAATPASVAAPAAPAASVAPAAPAAPAKS